MGSTTVELPENVRSVRQVERAWNGVHVEVTQFHCRGPVDHLMPHGSRTRLNAVLAELGGSCEPRLRAHQPCPGEHVPRHMFLAPAGLEIWGHSAGIRYVKDVNLNLDQPTLSETLGVDLRALDVPRLRFADDRVWTLLNLLADAVEDPDPSGQLLGDGLILAILGCLMGRPAEARRSRGLAPWQLRRVMAHLDAHLPERVELATLAALTGLSPAHFSRAFKASQGLSPYRWQLAERIRRAQSLLRVEGTALDQVAQATGFADAVHFGRTFRRLTGTTPAAWRRDRIA